jgi:hypothetical protein
MIHESKYASWLDYLGSLVKITTRQATARDYQVKRPDTDPKRKAEAG